MPRASLSTAATIKQANRHEKRCQMNSFYRRILVIAGVLIAAALILLLTAAGVLFGYARIAQNRAAAELHPFYDPPDLLATGEPGEIIRAAAIDAPDGVKAWRVLYHSTTYDGRDVPVSALVVTPNQPAPPGGFPVVSVAHGTVGMARTCAPSLLPFQRRTLTQGSFFTVMVKPFTDAGYAVAATDYQGLGTPGTNPYLVGEDAGRNVLDAARMVRALPDLELSDETLIWGHSQGGQAAAFAGQLAHSYAPNLDILGVVTGSPAAELGMIADEVAQLRKRSLLTGLMVMIVRAWSTAYPDLDPGSVLTPMAIQSMGILEQDCVGAVLLAYILYPAPDYIKPNATTTPPLPELIDENTPGGARTPVPILVFQGESDPLIRPQFTQAFVRRLCSAGDTVSLNMYPGKGHLSVIAPSMPDTLAWMADRLAQKPAASSC
jgi:alpha-beta hydrolase superfamily lysophospholipase